MLVKEKINTIDDKKLHLYISILTKTNRIEQNANPQALCKLLRDNFNVYSTEKQIIKYYEPTVDELELDIRLLYKNLGYS